MLSITGMPEKSPKLKRELKESIKTEVAGKTQDTAGRDSVTADLLIDQEIQSDIENDSDKSEIGEFRPAVSGGMFSSELQEVPMEFSQESFGDSSSKCRPDT